jgi:uroporphyrinogen decarboxylase
MQQFTSKERVLLALNHKESDHVPFDLGSTANTGIHINTYKNLLSHLGIKKEEFPILNFVQQTALIHEDVLQKLKVDIRGLISKAPKNWKLKLLTEGKYKYFIDEFGIKWRMPKHNGLYYDPLDSPLSEKTINKEKIDNYNWPEPNDISRIEGLEKQAKEWLSDVCPAILMEECGGEIFDAPFWLRGSENFYCDLAADPKVACYLMDKMVEFQMGYWKLAIEKLGKYISIVRLGDDLGAQNTTRISPEMYRKYVKPRQKKLFSFIKKLSKKKIYIFLHSCGSVYEIIPDFIEIGVDIINPVQVSAANMDSKKLKKEFGDVLTFWGGGVDTQYILPKGTPQQVSNEVKKRIDDFSPGGGFVFNPVHNIQSDVPPENIVAMWETWLEYGKYS